jgi:hypothetical protein
MNVSPASTLFVIGCLLLAPSFVIGVILTAFAGRTSWPSVAVAGLSLVLIGASMIETSDVTALGWSHSDYYALRSAGIGVFSVALGGFCLVVGAMAPVRVRLTGNRGKLQTIVAFVVLAGLLAGVAGLHRPITRAGADKVAYSQCQAFAKEHRITVSFADSSPYVHEDFEGGGEWVYQWPCSGADAGRMIVVSVSSLGPAQTRIESRPPPLAAVRPSPPLNGP